MTRREGDLRAAAICAVLAAALLAVLGLWRGEAFWSTSDGVYALTARLLHDGLGLYSDMATAQPPPVYLAGAGLLAVDDSLTALRAGLELVTLATALLVFGAVLGLTGRRWLAVAAGVLTPLTPVMLHENALLTPETLGAPLLLGTALLAARPRAAGAVAALAVGVKLSFALPALLVLLVLPGRRRALVAFVAAGGALAAAATALWGADLWRAIVVAQSQSGWTAVEHLPGLLAQEAWNVGPLAVAAGAALAVGRDEPRLRAVAAAAAGGLLLGLTVVKQGTYVNAIQVAEPPLLVLAACAAAWASGAWRRVLVACAALLVAQSGSLVLAPDDPRPYTRPFAEFGPRRRLSGAEVERYARAARACPPGAPFPGVSFVAFVAERRPLGDQPDPFILGAEENAAFLARVRADVPRACPATGAPVVDANGNVAGS